eukprot:scaffold47308_cov61-Phaeocystis_antarctica.AAC.2
MPRSPPCPTPPPRWRRSVPRRCARTSSNQNPNPTPNPNPNPSPDPSPSPSPNPNSDPNQAQHARLRRAVAVGESLGEAELAEFGRLDRKVQPGFTPGFCPVPPPPRAPAGGYVTPRRGGGGDAGGGGGGGGGAEGPGSAAAALHAKLAAGDMLTGEEMATLQQLASPEEAST